MLWYWYCNIPISVGNFNYCPSFYNSVDIGIIQQLLTTSCDSDPCDINCHQYRMSFLPQLLLLLSTLCAVISSHNYAVQSPISHSVWLLLIFHLAFGLVESCGILTPCDIINWAPQSCIHVNVRILMLNADLSDHLNVFIVFDVHQVYIKPLWWSCHYVNTLYSSCLWFWTGKTHCLGTVELALLWFVNWRRRHPTMTVMNSSNKFFLSMAQKQFCWPFHYGYELSVD